MSIETWLFVLVFLLLPLVQMFREVRQRAREQGRRQAAQGQPVPVQPPPPPNMQTQRPPEDANGNADLAAERPATPEGARAASRAAGDAAVRQPSSDKIAARRRSAQHEPTTGSLPDTAVRKEMRTVPEVIRGMRSRGGLQRAIVVMAILGPCRAVRPHAWREIDEPR